MEQLTVRIATLTDGSRTVAEAVLTTAYPHSPLATGAGSSGLEPGDKYDAQTGSELAIARSLRSVAARLERRARGRVNHAESVKAHKAEIAERAESKPDYDMAEEQRKPFSRRAWNITENERIQLFNSPW